MSELRAFLRVRVRAHVWGSAMSSSRSRMSCDKRHFFLHLRRIYGYVLRTIVAVALTTEIRGQFTMARRGARG